MGCYLKNEKKGKYLKDINTQEQKVKFTEKKECAKDYVDGSWYAETELDFLRFHFKNSKDWEIIKDMGVSYE